MRCRRPTPVRRLRTLVIVAAIFAGAGGLQQGIAADPPATTRSASAPAKTPEIPAATRRLLDQLSSDDWKTRQTAVDTLVALGDDALPSLRQALRNATDAEVKLRAQAAIAQILENRLVGVSLVTLKLDKVSPAKAFDELARQAHAKLPTEPATLLTSGKPKPVSLDVSHRPFWEVMQTICRQTGTSPINITRNNREVGLGLSRTNPEWNQKPIVLAGPLLIRADRLVRNSSVVLRDGGAGLDEFNVQMTVFAEPKLRVLDYSSELRLSHAQDDKGNSLVTQEQLDAGPIDTAILGNVGVGNSATWEIAAALSYPKNPGDRITHLRGNATFEVQIRTARLELPLPGTRNVSKNLDGVRILVRNLDTTRCDLSVYRDGRSEFEWERLRLMLINAEAQLLDERDRTVARSQHGVDTDLSNDANRLDLRLRFVKEGLEDGRDVKQKRSDAVKMIWEFPAETKLLSVPFEFRDLPIPK